MTSDHPSSARISPPSPVGQPGRRGLLAIVVLLGASLVIGGLVVVRELMRQPASSETSPSSSLSALENGLESAQTYLRERKFAEAETILQALADQAPSDRGVRLARAQALIGLERHAEALEQYEAAIALSGTAGQSSLKPPADGTVPTVERDPALAHIHFEAGTCANVAGRIDRAEEHYYMAQMLDAVEPRYPVYLAMMQIKKGDDAAANASLLRAVKVEPTLAEAWGTLAELALKQNRNGLAAQHVERARTLQPNVTRWRVVEARVFNRTGEAEKAAALLENLPVSERNEKAVLTTLAEAYGLLQKPFSAAKMYEQAAASLSSDAEIAYQAAFWFHRAGDLTSAKKFAQTASMMGHGAARDLEKQISAGE